MADFRSIATQKKRIILQQRCSHHVVTLCIRNLTISLPNEAHSSVSPHLYFTMHPGAKYLHDENNITAPPDEIYRSESIRYGSNPTWNHLSIPSNRINFTEFVVRLWIGTDDEFMPALQWNISLPTLNCIGDTLHSNHLVFHSNAIALGMHGKFYSSNSSVTLRPPLNSIQAYDFGETKNSYSVFALRRLFATRKSMKMSKDNVAILRAKSKKHMETERRTTEIKIELEQLSTRLKHAKTLLYREQSLLRREKERSLAFKLSLNDQEAKAKESESKRLEEIIKFHGDHEACIETKVQVSQLVKQLGLRRRDILAELSHIFPISSIEANKNPSTVKKPLIDKVHTICGVKLPESENFNQKEDMQTSVALGYTAQLLNMMSHFLLVPLRYPIVSKGSLSCVVDHVTEKLSERERLFPLHVKGNKDRFLSDYGVFLLNKNIAQLRYYCGLGTTDLRPTLENIRSLLEERLGAKSGAVGHQSQPIDIYNPNKEIAKASEKSFNRSPGDLTMPTGGYMSRFSGETAVKINQLNQTDTKPSPRRQAKRLGSRRTELNNLRGELFGSSDQANQRSPKEHRIIPDVDTSELDPTNSSNRFDDLVNATVSKSSVNMDSIESFSVIPPPHRVKYTGLEEIGQSDKKETKTPYISARAQLLGKLANQQSNDPAIRKNWSTATPLTGHLMEKRSELFRRRSPQKEEVLNAAANPEKFENDSSNINSNSYSDNIENDRSNVLKTSENSDFTNMASKVFSEPEVCIIDPSKSQLKLLDDSDDELDLC